MTGRVRALPEDHDSPLSKSARPLDSSMNSTASNSASLMAQHSIRERAPMMRQAFIGDLIGPSGSLEDSNAA
ncbi:hypothetical protein GCM10025867_47660 (plasmid) [Frondihabitans sucicola]|uniref:Uncharacterized protein n=1 Tax=Frondihabitans sucicola TaxID=1268041 RepID=A0ABN6Y5B9_9MICO|nr:hypothetical protein GCM10025867_47660 [Frondihabitans sucicola]